jgi:hypothetical protein
MPSAKKYTIEITLPKEWSDPEFSAPEITGDLIASALNSRLPFGGVGLAEVVILAVTEVGDE